MLPSLLAVFSTAFPYERCGSFSLSFLCSAAAGTKTTLLGMKRCPLIRSPEILNGLKCFDSWHWKLEIFYLYSRYCIGSSNADFLCLTVCNSEPVHNEIISLYLIDRIEAN